ncbi:TIGR02996 domain-containing protein [Gemmata sp.]|uniref:TIGR02996 domain-containing protein n=1 Tax=Gemmata sp. TaxID=1914242 RepID=UPI003F6FBD9D
MTGDELAFIEAVCSAPADDTPRLVYADWLQERGQEDRAAHIRWAVANPQNSMVCLCGCKGREPNPCETCQLFGDEVAGIPQRTDGESHYVTNRGFVCEVRCSAADWLAHADRIAWHPTQTVACPEVKWRVVEGVVDPDTLRRRRQDKYKDCGPCAPWCKGGCEGTGRVSRPCPATAQPITSVTLTTTPEGYWIDQDGEMVFVFTRGTTMVRSVREVDVYEMRNRRGTFGGTPHTMLDLLETVWPGITFTLPRDT